MTDIIDFIGIYQPLYKVMSLKLDAIIQYLCLKLELKYTETLRAHPHRLNPTNSPIPSIRNLYERPLS